MTRNSTPIGVDRPGLILALICLPVFIGALDLTIVSAVLPNVTDELGIDLIRHGDTAAWVVSGYLLAYTVSVALMGRISDLVGRRRTYFVSLLIFILGSWLAASATYAPESLAFQVYRAIYGITPPDRSLMALYALIFGRIVQAFGAGAMVPVSMALVGDLYPPEKRALPLGVVGAVDTSGWVLGHLYGGLMVQIVQWPVLFWINIPITTVIAVITWRQLARVSDSRNEGGLTRPALIVTLIAVGVINLLAVLDILRVPLPQLAGSLADNLLNQRYLTLALFAAMIVATGLSLLGGRGQEKGRADWGGAVFITLALIGLNVGLGARSESTIGSTSEPPRVSPEILAMGGVAFIIFILIEWKVKNPLLSLSQFRNRNISLASLINFLIGFCLMVGLVSVPLFVNTILDLGDPKDKALVSGILLATLTIPMALASIPGGLITERVGYRIPTLLGLLLAGIGFALGRTWTPDTQEITIGLHMGLAGIGIGLTIAPIQTSIINAAQEEQRGIASALVLIMRLVGMTIGISAMTSYGLQRVQELITIGLAALPSPADPAKSVEVIMSAGTTTIGEMLLFAAIVCAIAIIPAVFLRPREATSEAKDTSRESLDPRKSKNSSQSF